MSLFLELGLYTLVLYGIFWLLFYPIGVSLLSSQLPPYLRVPTGLCLGILIQGVFAVLLQMLGITPVMRSISTACLALLGLTLCRRGKGSRGKESSGKGKGVALDCRPHWQRWGSLHLMFFLFLLFCVHSAAFPDGDLRSSSAEVTQLLTGLPTDHLITYNTARFVVEGISPSIEVVPTWRVTERAPMAGMAVASVFHFLKLSETAHWLGSSPGVYYIFQSAMSFFNCLPLLAVFVLANEYLGRREGILGVLLLGMSPFFVLNAIYPWPKMMMAFFFITALALCLDARDKPGNFVLCGILMAGAYLCHSIALFYIVGFFLFVIFSRYGMRLLERLQGGLAALRRASSTSSGTSSSGPSSSGLSSSGLSSSGLSSSGPASFGLGEEGPRNMFAALSIKGILLTAMSCGALLLPWLLFTAWLGASSRRLLYMHAFCILDYDVDAVPLLSAMQRYYNEFGLSGILYTRWSNLLYPVDPFPLIGDVYRHGLSLTYLLERLSHYSFYALVFAYGPLGLPLIALGFVSACRKSIRLQTMSAILLTAFPFMLLIFGCASYLTNHIWVYPLFVGMLLWMPCVYRLPSGAVALALHLGVNIAVIVFGFWFGKQTSAYLHGDGQYLAIQVALLFVIVLTSSWLLYKAEAAESGDFLETEGRPG